MPKSQKAFAPRIKVFGVGGGAGTAITVLKCGNFNGVELIIGNTDICALEGVKADLRIQLGEKTAKGLGAGADPGRGRAAAEESIEEIRHALKGSDMAIILACLGGGTGTGSAPVVAQAARELGPFTVGVATMPFAFEGQRRITQAETGWRQFKTQVDTILTIPYERLFPRYQPKQRFIEMTAFADQLIGLALKGIIGQATQDQGGDDHFSAYKKMTRNKMWILLGGGMASGENRAMAAVRQALGCPFIENALDEAREIHLHIFCQHDLSAREIETITAAISERAKGTARIKTRMFRDDSLDEEIRVLIYSASGK